MIGSIYDDLRGNLPRGASGWLTLAVIAAAFAVLVLVLRRVLPANRPLRWAIVAVPALAVAWWLGSPIFVDERVEEDFPVAATGADATTPTPDGPPGQPETTEPVRLAGGTFRGIDHSASGGAALYRLADGRHIVRLEDVDIQNGPDLYVYLAPRPDQEGDGGTLNLGKLKGNQGSQNYELPTDVDPSEYSTVLIWCRRFAVPFANATLS